MPQDNDEGDSSLWTCMTTDEGTQCEKWPWIFGSIIVLGCAAGGAIWWKLRQHRRVKKQGKLTAECERLEKKEAETKQSLAKKKVDLEKAVALTEQVKEEKTKVQAALKKLRS
ncbi:hypothetical protein NCC49_004155 [Naganishia albida]|nr:hypothetical protein NCC49_004155 [Naganishia albida]